MDGVPPRLRAVIAACLAEDPAARPSLRAVRHDRRRNGHHRAVRGGVLAVLGGPADRRPPGAAGGADESRPEGVLIGLGHAPADHAIRTRGADQAGAAGASRRSSRPAGTRAALAGASSRAAPASLVPGRLPGSQAMPSSQVMGGSVGVQYPGAARLPSRRRRFRGSADGYPQPYQGGAAPRGGAAARQHGHRGPADVRRGSLALIWAIGVIAVSASIVKRYPLASRSRRSPPGRGGNPGRPCCTPRTSRSGSASRGASRRGSGGAGSRAPCCSPVRTGGVGVVTSSQAGLGPAKMLTLIGWLIGLGGAGPLAAPVQRLLHRAPAGQRRSADAGRRSGTGGQRRGSGVLGQQPDADPLQALTATELQLSSPGTCGARSGNGPRTSATAGARDRWSVPLEADAAEGGLEPV